MKNMTSFICIATKAAATDMVAWLRAGKRGTLQRRGGRKEFQAWRAGTYSPEEEGAVRVREPSPVEHGHVDAEAEEEGGERRPHCVRANRARVREVPCSRDPRKKPPNSTHR